MKNAEFYIYVLTYSTILFLLIGCEKFLEQKPDASLVTPTTISDARALLDTYGSVNTSFISFGQCSGDDYYVTNEMLDGTDQASRELYLFQLRQDPLVSGGWRNAYARINRANLVIDLLEKINPSNAESLDFEDCLGQAYFYRALNHFLVAQFFASAYDPSGAVNQPGIPSKLSPDVNEPTVRGTLEQTYAQIEVDLEHAIESLPVNPTAYFRPGRAAAFSLMAHVMMHMRRFQDALSAAQDALTINGKLIDFNTINPNATISFERFNTEVLFQAQISGQALLSFNNWKADSILYRQYEANDLRKAVYFRSNGTGTYGFKGDLGGVVSGSAFGGISTGETYLLAAEAAARTGKVELAMSLLNNLLIKRYRTGSFTPLKASNASEAFELIVNERRKELIGRGLRWLDLRRWQAEGLVLITIKRLYKGKEYLLKPNGKNYVFEIPSEVIDMTNIEQNQRE